MKIRIFWENKARSLLSFHQPLTTCQVSEKSNEQIPRKVRHRRTDERTDGWTGLNLRDPFSTKSRHPRIALTGKRKWDGRF